MIIADIIKNDQELKNLINSKKELNLETINFLIDEDVYKYLGGKENSQVKELLKMINEKIPKINYSYHRPDRYDFDYSWAEAQL